MSETWGDAEITTLREHVQAVADERDALRAENARLRAKLRAIADFPNHMAVGSVAREMASEALAPREGSPSEGEGRDHE